MHLDNPQPATEKAYLLIRAGSVISQREFERLLYHKEKKIAALKTITMIQCVNCRNEKHPYCSRICCTHAVAKPAIEDNPQVWAKNGRLELTFLDRIIGEKMSLNPDLLILSNGIESYHNERLADIAGLELNRDGFFAEVNPKSAPLDSVDRGKYFCGICQGKPRRSGRPCFCGVSWESFRISGSL